MRYIFWNIRGFGHSGRRTLLKEYITREGINFVAFQETIKADFSHRNLTSIDPFSKFEWRWVPASGHSGGILLGCNRDCCDVLSWSLGIHFVSVTVKHQASARTWAVVAVYGPADHSLSANFLGEIRSLVHDLDLAQIPVLVGGDFNLIRSGADKSNSNIDWPRVHLFNDAIASMDLREVARSGACYTWTKKQLAPIRSVLDMIFMSVE